MGLNNFILTCERENEKLTKDLQYHKNYNGRLLQENRELKIKNSITEEKYKIVDEINQKYKEVIDKLKEKCKPKTSDYDIWLKLSEDWKTLDRFNKNIRYNLHPIITDAYRCDIKNSINKIIEVTKNEVLLKEDILDILKTIDKGS